MESGSHLREHPDPVKLTLLAALLHSREREITDALVELLIWPCTASVRGRTSEWCRSW